MISVADGQGQLIQEQIKTVSSDLDIKTVSRSDYHHLMSISDIAVVTSGTASWEAAMHSTPQIVGYKTTRLNYEVARRLITVPHISLVNLMLDKQIVPELLQSELNSQVLLENIIRLNQSDAKSAMRNSYKDIQSMSYNRHILKNTLAAITS